MPAKARVLIVDDSRIFRSALESSLSGQDEIEIVGSVFSGEKAMEFIEASSPDVVTLDVEMPGMGGLATLKAIRRLNAAAPPGNEVGAIMVSAHTKRGADVTLQALQAGAFDFIAKPSGPRPEDNLNSLRAQLLNKIHAFMAARERASSAGGPAKTPASPLAPEATAANRSRWLQAAGNRPVGAIVVASSTGGPKALETLIPSLIQRVELPILVVQHMPPRFTRSLAESLGRMSQGTVLEAGDGEPVRAKTAYIAPGGKHLLVRKVNNQLVTALNEQPPENGCRPSADVLFRSAAAMFGAAAVAIVLTGMGRDGTAGLGAIKRAGGYAIAQDEATSVVWGMPGSAVEAGLADEILPLGHIAAAVETLVSRGV
jgi:two-component system, chemotaxis family, protein-glutamate methylesterase/glutaminase